MFVEARTAGQDDYRTLPDANGNTSEDTGRRLHGDSDFWLSENPFLRRYIVRNAVPGGFECTPTQPGIWNAASGNSGGFQDWRIDLSAYAGRQVEVSIVYVTDPGSRASGCSSTRSWPPRTARRSTPPGSRTRPSAAGRSPRRPRAAGEHRRLDAQPVGRVVDGPGVRTGHSIIWGFGLEGVAGADTRAALLRDALVYFGAAE